MDQHQREIASVLFLKKIDYTNRKSVSGNRCRADKIGVWIDDKVLVPWSLVEQVTYYDPPRGPKASPAEDMEPVSRGSVEGVSGQKRGRGLPQNGWDPVPKKVGENRRGPAKVWPDSLSKAGKPIRVSGNAKGRRKKTDGLADTE